MDLSLPLPKEMERKYPKEAANTCLVAGKIEDVKIGFGQHMMPKLRFFPSAKSALRSHGS